MRSVAKHKACAAQSLAAAPCPSSSLHAASNGKLSCPWKAAEATLSDANWERWRAAADRLQLFNADPDAYIEQHGYY